MEPRFSSEQSELARNKVAIGLEQMRAGQVIDGQQAVAEVLAGLRRHGTSPAGTAISARKGGGRDGEDDGTRTRNHRRDRPVL